MSDKRGPLFVLACYISWGILPIYWKMMSRLDSFYVMSTRILWSMIFMALILTVTRDWQKVREIRKDRREVLRLAAAGVFICINWSVYIWTVAHGHMLDGSLAYYMNPILSVLVGTLVFREKLSGLQWLAVSVTFTGLVITVIRYGQIPWLALAIGGSFAVYGAIKKGAKADAGTATFFETLFLTPLGLAIILSFERRGMGAMGELHGWEWLLLPLCGVVTTLPLLCFSKGIKTTPMSLSGILMNVNPTLQLGFSVLLYHEEFTTTHAILFGFVWTGLVLYLVSGFVENRKKEKLPCE